MAFDIYRDLKLNFLGEEWKDCYIRFSYLTANEAKEFTSNQLDKDNPEEINSAVDKAIDILKKKFVKGTAISDGKIVNLTKDDIDELPVEVLNKCIEALVGVMPEGEKKEATE